jgi:galactan endo-1,6-beta-galactosidase
MTKNPIVTIVPTSNWGTWEGWGTSLAWWAKKFGNQDDLADIFFSLNWQELDGRNLPGLGLNIVRYNAGACSWNKIGDAAMVVSPSMIVDRQMEAYWTDWFSSDSTSASWNWNVDLNQRAMMLKAKLRLANRFELFSNSPVWWMCNNHNPAGADQGGNDNLQSWNVENHGIYLATIAQHARDFWGILFESVEPFNEPDGNWWSGLKGTQEGCYFNPISQKPVINALRSELNNRGLSSTLVAASDDNTYDDAIATWAALGEGVQTNIGRVNVHGYQEGNGRRDLLYSAIKSKGKSIWNSEYGEGDSTGRRLVSNLILDFRWLHPTAWIYWQVIDGFGWGLIDEDVNTGLVGAVSQKYFILAMFSRHIREGMRILDSGSDNVVVAYDENRLKLIVVAVNWGPGQYINFELSKFSQPSTDGSRVLRWRTQIGNGDQYADYPNDTFIRGTRFWSWFDTDTVQTFEIDHVKL